MNVGVNFPLFCQRLQRLPNLSGAARDTTPRQLIGRRRLFKFKYRPQNQRGDPIGRQPTLLSGPVLRSLSGVIG